MATHSLTQPRRRSGRAWDIAQLVLNVATVLSVVGLIWMALAYARPAVNLQGDEQMAQRIFYIHMACNFGAFAGFLMSVVGSVTYLITRDLDWDRVTQASIEVATVIGLGTIVSGAIWSKPTWNTYWT